MIEGNDPTHSDERRHADAQRAVGGCHTLIREISRISAEIDPLVPADWMIKRSLFFAYELVSRVEGREAERDRLALLNKFIFEEKRFECLCDTGKLREPWEAYLFNSVLVKRAGAPTVLALLYAFLADRIGVKLEFVDLKPTCFLKWTDQGRSRFIDITRSGSTLSSDELIETLHTRFQMPTFGNAGLLETFSFESYLADYLTALKTVMITKNDPEQMLFLQNTLIAYQPSNLHLLAERAILHRRVGNFKSALADLKRFFAFHEREKASAELVKLHDDLVKLLERHKAGTELREEL
jgi:regulator of sirC expression with transglutaminase-like and TPR domain